MTARQVTMQVRQCVGCGAPFKVSASSSQNYHSANCCAESGPKHKFEPKVLETFVEEISLSEAPKKFSNVYRKEFK